MGKARGGGKGGRTRGSVSLDSDAVPLMQATPRGEISLDGVHPLDAAQVETYTRLLQRYQLATVQNPSREDVESARASLLSGLEASGIPGSKDTVRQAKAELARRRSRRGIAPGADPARSRLAIRQHTYRGEAGFTVSGTDAYGRRGISIFTTTRASAERMRDLLRRGWDVSGSDWPGQR